MKKIAYGGLSFKCVAIGPKLYNFLSLGTSILSPLELTYVGL